MKYYVDRTTGKDFFVRIASDGSSSYFDVRSRNWVDDEVIADEIEFSGDWERIDFWEYFQMWWDVGFVRVNDDLMIAEVFGAAEGEWLRQDAWSYPILYRGDGAETTEAEALEAIERWRSSSS